VRQVRCQYLGLGPRWTCAYSSQLHYFASSDRMLHDTDSVEGELVGMILAVQLLKEEGGER